MTRPPYDSAELQRYAESGLSIGDIADELGISYGAAKAGLSRRGIKATPEYMKTIRQRAEGMPLREAVVFLIDQIELLAECVASGASHPVDAWGIKFTPAQRRLVLCLYDANGGLRTREQLHAAVMFNGTGNESEPKIVGVLICTLRKKIPDHIARIVTHWGVGYSLHLEASA